jgi:hypothetical protein
MSVGIGKGWKVWRNQNAASGKQMRQADELKKRFGHKNGLTKPDASKPTTPTPEEHAG